MSLLSRVYHRWRARCYNRLASRLQRNLTEYVLSEESRITIYLHRAGWHVARAVHQDTNRRPPLSNREQKPTPVRAIPFPAEQARKP